MEFKYVLQRVLCFVTISVLCNGDDFPSVNTPLGELKGLALKTVFKGNAYIVERYAGLRYAKAPVGELRFKKPEPYGKFPSPLDAFESSSTCPQNDMMKLGADSVDEDCLSLDVYVPTGKSNHPNGLAVMIFVHGGGFAMGGTSIYPGEVLSGFGNVIVVVINYRLGLLGFANSGDGQIQGNLGLWDQRLAFQWVHNNIASFGGDTSRVTIFGESAGSVSVTMHGMYPPNKGLFQNIIAQSGAPTMPFQIVTDNMPSLSFIAESLGCKTESTDVVVACLKQVDVADLMSKLGELTKEIENQVKLQFMPTIDGDFIKQPPAELIKQAQYEPKQEIDFFRSINLINGMNSAEGAMWLMMLGNVDYETVVVSHDDMKTVHIPTSFAAFINPTGREVSDALISVVAAEYTDWDTPSNARNMFIKLMGDLFFYVPGGELVYTHANSSESKSWSYRFDANIEKHLIPQPSWIKGANHADELASVFGYCLTSIGAMFNLTDYKPPDWELDMSERIMTYWSNFAKFGNPNGMDADPVSWLHFDMGSSQHMTFNREDSLVQNIYAKEVNFWREIVPLIWDAVEHAHSKDSPFSWKSTESCDADGNCG